jgi:hypothetical protein
LLNAVYWLLNTGYRPLISALSHTVCFDNLVGREQLGLRATRMAAIMTAVPPSHQAARAFAPSARNFCTAVNL